MKYDTIIFDLGGVLIDWNPVYVFRNMFETERDMRHFFDNVCTSEWNEQQDAGRSLAEATETLIAEHPDFETAIRAYYGRWEEMLGGPIEPTVEVFKKLKSAGKHRLLALTNWSAETFPVALERYDFLHWFEGVVVSGTEKTRKPHADFYKILLDRYEVEPSKALFIDDVKRNVEGAQAVGIDAIHFLSAEQLEAELRERGVVF